MTESKPYLQKQRDRLDKLVQYGNWDAVISEAKTIIANSKDHRELRMVDHTCFAHARLAHAYIEAGQLDNAEKSLQDYLKLARARNRCDSTLNALDKLLLVYSKKEDWHTMAAASLEYLQAALQYNKNGDIRNACEGWAKACGNLPPSALADFGPQLKHITADNNRSFSWEGYFYRHVKDFQAVADWQGLAMIGQMHLNLSVYGAGDAEYHDHQIRRAHSAWVDGLCGQGNNIGQSTIIVDRNYLALTKGAGDSARQDFAYDKLALNLYKQKHWPELEAVAAEYRAFINDHPGLPDADYKMAIATMSQLSALRMQGPGRKEEFEALFAEHSHFIDMHADDKKIQSMARPQPWHSAGITSSGRQSKISI